MPIHRLFGIACLVLSVIGCNQGPQEPTRYPVRGTVLLDGKPLAGHAVSVYAGQARYSEKKPVAEVTTDKAGRFSFKPQKPGVYLAMSRHRPTPDQQSAQGVSYTYSVVIEATE